MSINYAPRTWVVSELVTAAELNAEIRDPLTGIQAAHDTYTPVLTGSVTNPTLGTGSSQTGTYIRYGKTLAVCSAEIVFGTAGVAVGSGSYAVSLPFNPTAGSGTTGRVMGYGIYFDSSTAFFYRLIAVCSSTNTVRMLPADAAGSLVSNTVPVVPAASDQIRLKISGELA